MISCLFFGGEYDAFRMEKNARRYHVLKSTNESMLTDQMEEQLFLPKESAYERRNRGQKWYREFGKRRK